MAAALLVFLMPIYFLLSLFGAAQSVTDYVALGAGLVLGRCLPELVGWGQSDGIRRSVANRVVCL